MSKPIDTKILALIGKYILEGLTESEACLMSDAKLEDLDILKENNEKIRDFIEKQKVKFKYSHLQEMQTKKSDKTSQWLLERLRPEDFSTQKSKSATTINIIGTIIKQIQQDDRPTQLVSRTREDRYDSERESHEDDKGRERVVSILE